MFENTVKTGLAGLLINIRRLSRRFVSRWARPTPATSDTDTTRRWLYSGTCDICGTPYQAKSKFRAYCSSPCKQLAYRQRRERRMAQAAAEGTERVMAEPAVKVVAE
jgi:hypothetical protein